MKLSNELKVGALALVAVISLIFGFRYLKGKDVFSRTPKLYAVFSSVGGLEKSNFVKINGLTVGTVYDMVPADENLSAIKVTLSISQNINIPENSTAYIAGSLLGASSIVIEKGDAKTYLKTGDRIATRVEEGLLGDLTSEAKPLMSKVGNVADSINLLLSGVNSTLSPSMQQDLQASIAHLKLTIAALNSMISEATQPLSASLNNINAITANLKNQNQGIEQILNNANTFSKDLAQLRLENTLDTLNQTMAEVKGTLAKISSPDGSLGALINDKRLYNKLNNVMLSAEILLDDLRVHPKRYVNISVFGRKNKPGELTAPALKDSIPR